MKAGILAGGLGTRISEETAARPKPMVEIGGKPILWHIMKSYSAHGVQEFVVWCGYKGYMIKEYFANYFLHMSDVTFDMRDNAMEVLQKHVDRWRVTLVDTGEHTMTGDRLKRVRGYLGDADFCMTYGDGVSDIDITALLRFHARSGKLATITAVQPPRRFGTLDVQDDQVRSFVEKPHGDGAWINGGFFVLSPRVIDYIEHDSTLWERGPVERLAVEGQLNAFVHRGSGSRWTRCATRRCGQHHGIVSRLQVVRLQDPGELSQGMGALPRRLQRQHRPGPRSAAADGVPRCACHRQPAGRAVRRRRAADRSASRRQLSRSQDFLVQGWQRPAVETLG